MTQQKSITERFFEKVSIPDNPDACWEWTGGKISGGYGILYTSPTTNPTTAHRFSYEYHVGNIDQGLCVLHKCDNKTCVNPRHLFTGTLADNIHDMDRKGRRVNCIGESAPTRKLTESQVIEIRSRHSRGESFKSLSRAFGIADVNIAHVCKRNTWKHI